jgi:hypothetical protein
MGGHPFSDRLNKPFEADLRTEMVSFVDSSSVHIVQGIRDAQSMFTIRIYGGNMQEMNHHVQ